MDNAGGGMMGNYISQGFENLRRDYVREGDQQWNEQNQLREQGFQREMAQHGVRWRVEDAKAAGLHPLFALGAQLPGGQPSPIATFDSAGASTGQAPLPRSQTAAEHAAAAQALKTSEALEAKYYAEAQESLSRARRMDMERQPDAPSTLLPSDKLGGQLGNSGVTIPDRQQYVTGNRDAIEMKAPQILSSRTGDTSTAPGFQAGWQEVVMFDNKGKRFTLFLPASPSGEGWGESMEGIGPLALTIAKNIAEGKGWEAIKHAFGLEGDMPIHMPPARKEFRGDQKPWWWKPEGRAGVYMPNLRGR